MRIGLGVPIQARAALTYSNTGHSGAIIRTRRLGSFCVRIGITTPVRGAGLRGILFTTQGGINLYGYCDNNAIMSFDILGTDVGAVFGGISGGLFGGITFVILMGSGVGEVVGGIVIVGAAVGVVTGVIDSGVQAAYPGGGDGSGVCKAMLNGGMSGGISGGIVGAAGPVGTLAQGN